MQQPRTLDSRRRDGFTLIELMVVLAVMGVLLALLLPAVQKIREASFRTVCQNNLRQIGLAFLNHESMHNNFPSGGWEWWMVPSYANGAPLTGPEQTASWAFQILPFLDADTVWKAGPQVAIATPHPVFFCPSRRGPMVITYPDQYVPQLTGGNLKHALCDYAGSNWDETGVIRQYYPTPIAAVLDGTATTLLVGEKCLNRAVGQLNPTSGQPWPDDNEGYTAGWDEDTMRSTSKPPRMDGFGGTSTGGQRFGSSHANAFHTVFADGSVHSISYNIDPAVWEAIGGMRDGVAIDPGSY